MKWINSANQISCLVRMHFQLHLITHPDQSDGRQLTETETSREAAQSFWALVFRWREGLLHPSSSHGALCSSTMDFCVGSVAMATGLVSFGAVLQVWSCRGNHNTHNGRTPVTGATSYCRFPRSRWMYRWRWKCLIPLSHFKGCVCSFLMLKEMQGISTH